MTFVFVDKMAEIVVRIRVEWQRVGFAGCNCTAIPTCKMFYRGFDASFRRSRIASFTFNLPL